MIHGKTVWKIFRISTILFWILLAIIGFGVANQFSEYSRICLVLLLVIHLAEIPIALSIGRKRDLAIFRIIVSTLVLGFTWWVPLKIGIIRK